MGSDETNTVDEGAGARGSGTSAVSSRYKLGSPIGRGGMGEVVTAQDEQIGREVAIKRIAGEANDRRIARFVREARIQGRLQHPAIPPVHELGRDRDGLPFFAMKKLAGTTLSTILAQRAPGAQRQRLLRAFADICLAVEFAHVNGVIHRDVKPDNIVLGDFGEVYLIDWGVAKVVADADEPGELHGDDAQTRTGAAIGTPGYWAPEQARGDEVIDARADVYSLGCVLRDLLRDDPDAPPELAAVCERATRDDREARIQTARELAEAVQRYLDGDRDLALRRQLAGEHQERADAAFRAGDDAAHRRVAMREAGRALALDPELAPAASLIGRLVLEPPRTPPPEVDAAMRADAVARLRSVGRAAFAGAFGYLIVVPGLVTMRSWPYAVFACVAIGLAFAVAIATSRGRLRSPIYAAAAHALCIVLIARMYSSMWFAPAVVPVIGMAIGIHPFMAGVRSSLVAWAWLVVPLFAIGIAERAGAIASTVATGADGALVVRGLAMVDGGPSPMAMGALALLAVATVAVVFTHIHRVNEQRLRLAFHLQAWQVRQLVPDA